VLRPRRPGGFDAYAVLRAWAAAGCWVGRWLCRGSAPAPRQETEFPAPSTFPALPFLKLISVTSDRVQLGDAMKIERVSIKNFRGINYAHLENLGDLVVLAGPNGSGKSSILDAIRLIKSSYGGYFENEFENWFSEFQVNCYDPKSLLKLFLDPLKDLEIEIEVSLLQEEISYIKEHAESALRNLALTSSVIYKDLGSYNIVGGKKIISLPGSMSEESLENSIAALKTELQGSKFFGCVRASPGGFLSVFESKTLKVLFSTFDVEKFGVLDYHGPHRNYGREALSSISIDFSSIAEQRRQHSLYNYNNKYAHIKNEMGSLYVREAIIEQARRQRLELINPTGNIEDFLGTRASKDLTNTLKILFKTFFPDKEFLGPQPQEDGKLHFPVKISDNAFHDLDELSSGEKEILYGYLRLRSTASKNSIILLDEPELHLNPKLARNLPEFYYRHLAQSLGNQVWLVTHSDAILRGSVNLPKTSVFHMNTRGQYPIENNQTVNVFDNPDVESAIVSLVGDLATFNPSGPILILEGEGSEFDRRVVSDLFPDLESKINLISGTNKARVLASHDALENLAASGLIKQKIYSITDKDFDEEPVSKPNRACWDVYHIENYLIETKYIREVLIDILPKHKAPSEEEIDKILKICANKCMDALVREKLSSYVNRALVSSIKTDVDRKKNLAEAMIKCVHRSRSKIEENATTIASDTSIVEFIENSKASFERDLQDGRWRTNFRGRDIIKSFIKYCNEDLKFGMPEYSIFSMLILAKMKSSNHQPSGMKSVLDALGIFDR
jgi:ABC-type lipoprotein export system ATPase subunit